MRAGGLPESVTVCEVGPRDGLQNEPTVLDTETKVRFIELLADAGLPYVEATSFVSPRWIPQLGDHTEIMQRIRRARLVRYPVLVPNQRGLENALAAGVREICIFTGVTETFTKKNINRTVDESLQHFEAIVERAKSESLWVRAYLSCAFGCPYEGAVDPRLVVSILERLSGMGCDEVSVGDTIGVADPMQVTDLVERIASRLPLEQVAMHFHDTRGMAIANVCAALEGGITIFDTACGGLGGCPFAPGASGNLATEDLLYLMERLGIQTGVSLEKVAEAARFIQSKIGRPLPGRMLRAHEACRAR